MLSGALPNKRLKLAGADRSKGNGVLCAGAHELSFFASMPITERVEFLMRCSDLHLNLVALAADRLRDRVQGASTAYDEPIDSRINQARLTVKASALPNAEGAA